MTLLEPEEIDRRFAEFMSGDEPDIEPEPTVVERRWRWIRPFADAADELIDICTSTDGRWFFGIKQLDDLMRGVGKGQLCYMSGRSHSGKTQVLLTSLVNNPGARVLYFTPDETVVELLAKLVSMLRGIDGEQLERRIRQGDQAAIDAVVRTATDDFKNLIVIDETLSFDQMTTALREAEELWSAPADLVCIDYLELLGDGEIDNVVGLSKEMKRWTKAAERPVICLRQNSRTSSKRGQAAGMEGMSYAGQNEAIYVLEVFRKGEDESIPESDRDLLRDSITVNLAKNKRPPCKRGMVDLHMDPATGIVRVPQPEDSTYRKPPQTAPKAALAAHHAARAGGWDE